MSGFSNALLIGAISTLLLAPSISWTATLTAAFYVSPQGNDSNSGTTPKTPFASLEHAEAAMRASRIKTTYLLSGVYRRTGSLKLTGQDAGETWAAFPNSVPILDGGGGAVTAVDVRADGVSLRGLMIAHFRENGVLVVSSKHVRITGNLISDIASSGWAQGAINVMFSASDVEITGNQIENTTYDGIIIQNRKVDTLKDVFVVGNSVRNSCKMIKDCGAIHIDDRAHSARNIEITGNTISNFGPSLVEGRGIYLDDYISNVNVLCNIVRGRGTYAVQIHGGDHISIVHNLVDLSDVNHLILYQSEPSALGNFGMRDNLFSDNFIINPSSGEEDLLRISTNPSEQILHIFHNTHWTAITSHKTTKSIREIGDFYIEVESVAAAEIKAHSAWTSACAYKRP